MTKYRKKPVVIEAIQWFKNGDLAVVQLYNHPIQQRNADLCQHCGVKMSNHGWIDTLEAGHNVCPGDWIITGVDGERYPCKPGIFEQTYDIMVQP